MTTQPDPGLGNTTLAGPAADPTSSFVSAYGYSRGPVGAGPYGETGAGPYGPTRRYAPPLVGDQMRRSASDRMLAGVCGGIAEYSDIDPVYIRLAFLVSLFWGGFGFFAYIVAAVVMPRPLS